MRLRVSIAGHLATLAHLVACGATGVDPSTYADAVRLAESDPKQAVAACRGVSGGAGQECLALAARAVAQSDPGAAQGVCDRITDPVWRDECAFFVAERRVEVVGAEAGIRSCELAGQFGPNCCMHGWSVFAAQTQTQTAGDLAAAATRYAPALQWCTALRVVDEPIRERFWTAFLDQAVLAAFRAHGVVGVGWCEGLPDACPTALAVAFREGLTDAVIAAGAAPCAEGSDAERLGRIGVRWAPDPSLDREARRFLRKACAGNDALDQ